MKRNFYLLIALVCLLCYLVSCKSASKLYEKGNYDEAVVLASKKLQKKPGDRDLQELLQHSYRYATEDHERNVRNHSASSNELKWEWIYQEYASLQRLYEILRSSPATFRAVRANDYSGYLSTYADKAAETRVIRGQRWMDMNDKKSYRNAYHEFNAALGFKPGDFGIITHMEEAYRLAVVHVVVMTAQHPGTRFSSYDYGEMNQPGGTELLRNLQNQGNNQFVKFYTPQEARSLHLQPDEVIEFRNQTLHLGRQRDEHSSREASKELVTREIVYRPDSIVKIYGRVKASITSTKRTFISDGSLQVIIRDADGHGLWSNDFRGEHEWSTEFSSYTGDERALSESDKQLLGRVQDHAPREEEIMRHISREINNRVLSGIRDFYSR